MRDFFVQYKGIRLDFQNVGTKSIVLGLLLTTFGQGDRVLPSWRETPILDQNFRNPPPPPNPNSSQSITFLPHQILISSTLLVDKEKKVKSGAKKLRAV